MLWMQSSAPIVLRLSAPSCVTTNSREAKRVGRHRPPRSLPFLQPTVKKPRGAYHATISMRRGAAGFFYDLCSARRGTLSFNAVYSGS